MNENRLFDFIRTIVAFCRIGCLDGVLIFPDVFFCAGQKFWFCTKLRTRRFAWNAVKNLMNLNFYAGFHEDVNTF